MCFSALSEATDVTPINMDPSPRLGLPDFGGHSPIRTNQGGRPHGTNHYYAQKIFWGYIEAHLTVSWSEAIFYPANDMLGKFNEILKEAEFSFGETLII